MPVTHWGRNSLFGDGSNRDAFELYFKPVSNVRIQDIARINGATFFPPKWNQANLMEADVAKWYVIRRAILTPRIASSTNVTLMAPSMVTM